jgi:hypothetical protein
MQQDKHGALLPARFFGLDDAILELLSVSGQMHAANSTSDCL